MIVSTDCICTHPLRCGLKLIGVRDVDCSASFCCFSSATLSLVTICSSICIFSMFLAVFVTFVMKYFCFFFRRFRFINQLMFKIRHLSLNNQLFFFRQQKQTIGFCGGLFLSNYHFSSINGDILQDLENKNHQPHQVISFHFSLFNFICGSIFSCCIN